MNRTRDHLDRFTGGFLILLMAVSVVNVLWQVVSRFVLNDPSSFTEELGRFLLIWVGVLGSGWAVGRRAHLALDLLPQRLDGSAARRLSIVIDSCILGFAVLVMIIGGARLVWIQAVLGQTSASLGLPIGLVYSVIPLSGLLMAFHSTVHILESIRGLAAARGV